MRCPDPTSPSNGYIEVSQYSGHYEYGSVATYHCNPGYILDSAGLDRAKCGEGGVWETDRQGEEGVRISHQGTTVTPAPRCLPVSCDNPPLVHHTVLDLINGTTGLGSLLVYQCEPGYMDLSHPGGLTVSQCPLCCGGWRRTFPRSEQHLGQPPDLSLHLRGSHLVQPPGTEAGGQSGSLYGLPPLRPLYPGWEG